jgi:hypothetical protein
MVPCSAFQVTAVFEAAPATVAANVVFAPVCSEIADGVTVTLVTPGLGFEEVTVISAVPALDESATEVAVTIEVPAVTGAV